MEQAKNIGILCDERPFWDELAEFLREVNAKLFMAPAASWEVLGRRPLDLLVLSAEAHGELPARRHHLATLVVHDEPPRQLAAAPPASLARVAWPLRKEQLHTVTSRLLQIPPRREFHSLIRFFFPGQDRSWIGRTVDFSLSGLAFSSDEALEPGTVVDASLSLPNHGSSLRLSLEVMRKRPAAHGEPSTYGAQFVGIDARSATIIEEFVRSA